MSDLPTSAAFELAWASAEASVVNTFQPCTRTDDIGQLSCTTSCSMATGVDVSTSFAAATPLLDGEAVFEEGDVTREQWELSCLPKRFFESPEEAQQGAAHEPPTQPWIERSVPSSDTTRGLHGSHSDAI
ncbi:hypothetical protein PHYPSEUDO_003182 [Phytophthora pseudosyringae]|uniref:Uncharacterized protein n=1 Tax=Phytophthora pseudosyringae TaxID=221518 RepID=A0A8T1VVI6_9STRA|nr:hypothetical protein PHYPSEUDO_003182 [Phytophthora pseudosyringae]